MCRSIPTITPLTVTALTVTGGVFTLMAVIGWPTGSWAQSCPNFWVNPRTQQSECLDRFVQPNAMPTEPSSSTTTFATPVLPATSLRTSAPGRGSTLQQSLQPSSLPKTGLVVTPNGEVSDVVNGNLLVSPAGAVTGVAVETATETIIVSPNGDINRVVTDGTLVTPAGDVTGVLLDPSIGYP